MTFPAPRGPPAGATIDGVADQVPGGPADLGDDDGFERVSRHALPRLRLAAPRRRTLAVAAALAAAIAVTAGVVAVVATRAPGSAPTGPPTPVPPARQAAAMTYDSVASVTVMYGGYDAAGHNLFDTWLWTGSSWSLLHGGVMPRLESPALTDDPADGGALLVGGAGVQVDPLCAPAASSICSEPGGPDPVVTQTWLFRAGAWQQVGDAGDQPRVPATMATVPGTSGVVAIVDTTVRSCGSGGIECPLTPAICVASPVSVGCLDSIRVSTWYWANKHWTAIAQVLDLDSGLVLVPGTTNGTLQLVSLYAPPIPSCINADGGCPVVTAATRSWHWATGSWVADPPTTNLPPLQPGLVAVAGSRALLLARDGHAWLLSDGTWVALPMTAPMSPRYQAAFAADRNGDWVLFGGTGPHGGAGSDTWLLTGDTWQHRSGSPPVVTASPAG